MLLISASWGCDESVLSFSEAEADLATLARARVEAAARMYTEFGRRFVDNSTPLQAVYEWSLRWMEAQIYQGRMQAERLPPIDAHLSRMRATTNFVRERTASGRYWLDDYLGVDNYCAEAEVMLAKETRGPLYLPMPSQAPEIRLATARLIFEAWRRAPVYPETSGGTLKNTETAFCWSRRWLEAQTALASSSEMVAAAESAYLERSRELENLVKGAVQAGKASRKELDEAAFWRAEAELLVSAQRSKGEQSTPARLEAEKTRLDAAKAVCEACLKESHESEEICKWSNLWRKAMIGPTAGKAERVRAAAGHLDRIKSLKNTLEQAHRAGRVPQRQLWEIAYFEADAEILLVEAKTEKPR
jgi:hypothetical protein